MTKPVQNDLAGILADAACAAGQAVMQIYATDFDVRTKEDASPVTEADARAEDIILRHLSRAFPDIEVISEERDGSRSGPVPERFFLVDPLDGTREFISRNGEFTINIALVENGAPVAGVVMAPALSRLYITAGPEAAFVMEGTDAGSPESWQPVSVARPDRSALRVLASRSHGDTATAAFLETLQVGSLSVAGSSLKFCLIAAGEADVYPRFGRTMEWDTAAGHAVLAAAGGAVLTRDGSPLTYGKAADGFANPGFIAWGMPPAGA